MFLVGHGKKKLDWNTRLTIAAGAAQGLAYLHKDCTPQVVHRDVKSCNILLDATMEPHLADFGIAKNIQTTKTHTSTHVLGTIGYIDPEYAQTSRLNEKSDVYSFGIVLLELLTNKMAVDDEVNLLDWVCLGSFLPSQFLDKNDFICNRKTRSPPLSHSRSKKYKSTSIKPIT